MKRWLPILTVLLGFAVSVRAQEVDKAKLRASVWMPSGFPVVVRFLESFRDKEWAVLDGADSIPILRRELRGVPEDAIIYRKISIIYDRKSERDEGEEARAKALSLFRELRKRDATNAYWAVNHAIALLCEGSEASVRAADQIMRESLKADSSKWQHWLALGEFALFRAILILNEAMSERHEDKQEFNPRRESQGDRLGELIRIAVMQMDKARELAPNESEILKSQLLLHSTVHGFLTVLREQKQDAVLKGLKLDHDSLPQRFLDDVREMNRLFPDRHELLVSKAVLLMPGIRVKESRDEIRACAMRLEELAEKAEGKKAVDIWLGAAQCWWLLSEFERGSKCASKARTLDPENSLAWDVSIDLVGRISNGSQVLDLLRQQTKMAPSPTGYHLLARSAFVSRQFKDAEDNCALGLSHDRNDFACVLGLAATHLVQSDQGRHLAEAEKWLQRFETLLAGRSSADYLGLYGVFRALQGDTDVAKLYLQQCLQMDPANAGAKAALDAINK